MKIKMKKLLKSLVLAAVLSTSMYAVNYENDIAPTVKFITEKEHKNTNYQDFIWEQEKVNQNQNLFNTNQFEFNKNMSEFISVQKNFNETIVDKLKSSIRSNIDYSDIERLRSKIRDLESEADRLKSANNKLDQRIMYLERKVK